MLNESSSSATEIFAAAIQDYKRGIIVGEKQTFGKGSMQKTINLNQFIPNSKEFDFGALKVSNQKFYRITGESTQNAGVKSNLILPLLNEFKNTRKEFLLNSFKPSKIAATSFTIFQNNFQNVIAASNKLIAENDNLKIIKKEQKILKSLILSFKRTFKAKSLKLIL